MRRIIGLVAALGACGNSSSEPLDSDGVDPACASSDPFPATLETPSALMMAASQTRFLARDGNLLNAYTHRSATFDPQTGPIVFVVHGTGRDALGYLDTWRDEIDARGALAIAPEFPDALYPTSEDFALGVGTAGTPDSATYDPADWRATSDYTFSEIEHLFESVKTTLGSAQCRYFLYGHSAGGQFVHRLLTFLPDARVARAVAANPGWYTLPASGNDPNVTMPYGLQGAPPDPARLPSLFARDFVLLLGEADTVRDADLRTTTEADAQGQNRFERGQFYFATAQQAAQSASLTLSWRLVTVPGVGHTNAGMTPAAAMQLLP